MRTIYADLFKVDLHDLVSGSGLDRQHPAPAKDLVLHNVAHLVMLWASGCRAGSCRAPRKAHKFGRCLGGRGAAIAHTKTGGAGRARGAASAAKPGSTAATACITGAETAALRGIVFTVEVAAASAAAEAAGIAAPAGRAGVARGPTGDGITSWRSEPL